MDESFDVEREDGKTVTGGLSNDDGAILIWVKDRVEEYFVLLACPKQ